MFFWIFFVILFDTALSDEVSRAELERKVLQDIYMQSKFHAYVRPLRNETSAFDEAVIVSIDLYILQLDVDVKTQKIDFSIYFRQEWNDSRLSFDGQGKLEYIVLHDVIGFWTPDLFFVHEDSAHLHTVTKPNAVAKIFAEGRVRHSQRLNIKSSCPMNLKRYPFDKQKCELRVESYGYTASEILIQWKHGNFPPVTGTPQVVGYDTTHSQRTYIVSSGENKYSAAELEIHLKRHLTDFFLHIYMPITMFVLASWTSFWLSPKSQVVRLAISLTTILSTLMQLNINDYLFVTLGYPTALDVWVAVCCALLFAAFFENIYVIYSSQDDCCGSDNAELSGNRATSHSEDSEKTGNFPLVVVLSKLGAKKSMDSTARILFPSIAILFHILYIVYILNDSLGR